MEDHARGEDSVVAATLCDQGKPSSQRQRSKLTSSQADADGVRETTDSVIDAIDRIIAKKSEPSAPFVEMKLLAGRLATFLTLVKSVNPRECSRTSVESDSVDFQPLSAAPAGGEASISPSPPPMMPRTRKSQILADQRNKKHLLTCLSLKPRNPAILCRIRPCSTATT